MSEKYLKLDENEHITKFVGCSENNASREIYTI